MCAVARKGYPGMVVSSRSGRRAVARLRCARSSPVRQAGFSYLWVLMLVAFMGIGLGIASETYVIGAKRERERELLVIGRAFQEAIARYHALRPESGVQAYPSSLEDLLLDQRVPGTLRHLRKIYRDPMTGKAQWGLIKLGDRIVGVHSLSSEPVLKRDGFEVGQSSLANKETYEQWEFVVTEDKDPGTTPGAATAEPAVDSASPGEAGLVHAR